MMDAPALAVSEALRDQPFPVFAFEMEHLTIVGANEATYKFLDRPSRSLNGLPIAELVTEDDRPSVTASARLLGSGAVESYRAVRHFLIPNGTEVTAMIWVRLTTNDGIAFGLATIETDAAGMSMPIFDTSLKVALAVTNHDWTIEQVSNEIEKILGRSPDALKGSPLLGLFQPDDVQNLMLVVGRIVTDGGGATLRTHLRAANDRWREVCCLVVTMCHHSPPRLGLAFAAVPEFATEETPELHRQLAILGNIVFGGVDQLRSAGAPRAFSRRQWEVLTHLVRGERVEEIAAALYLSPSTVRNHLTAIYKKFGVHSQAGLMAKLFETLKAR